MDQSLHVAVNVTCRYVSKDVKIFKLFCETLHSQRTFDVASDGPIDSLIEIDTGCTVDNYVDCIDNELPIFW